jgi:hypothetical protein
MTRYLPIALGVVLIVGLTIVQARMTDRLSGSNVSAAQRKVLLDNVPMNIGDWHGTNIDIDEKVRQTAGAEGAIQRKYRNVRTNEEVDLWLIVGHGRTVARHTPDVCYRSSGFTARSVENSVYPMVLEDEKEVPFFTNTFFREDAQGRRLIRVFWTWFNSAKHGEKVTWEIDTNPTWYFGNTRALFKMYFTSVMRDPMETAEKSPCLSFAREFLPVVEKALAQVSDPTAKAAPKSEETGAEEAETKVEVKADEESPSDDNAEVPAPAGESAETPASAPSADEAPSTDSSQLLDAGPASTPTPTSGDAPGAK